MAISLRGMTLPGFVAGVDLSAAQYCFVKVSAANTVVLAGAGEFAIGVLQNKPKQGQAAEVWGAGSVSKVIAGGAVAAGALIAPDAVGKAKTAVLAAVNTADAGVASDPVIGSNVSGQNIGAAAAAANEIISVALFHMGAMPTTNA